LSSYPEVARVTALVKELI